jgi:hypothetical protein
MFVAQRIEPNPLVPTDRSRDFPRITRFFDGADLIVERTKQLMGNSKDLTLRIALFLFIIKDVIHLLW